MTPSPQDSTTYRSSSRYGLYLAVSLTVTLAFGWTLSQGFDTGSALFFTICLFGAIWSAMSLISRVAVDTAGLTLHAPPGRARRVEFRQLDSVDEGGRFIKVIVLLYHPFDESGLIDLDTLYSLTLPALENQTALLERLQAVTPK